MRRMIVQGRRGIKAIKAKVIKAKVTKAKVVTTPSTTRIKILDLSTTIFVEDMVGINGHHPRLDQDHQCMTPEYRTALSAEQSGTLCEIVGEGFRRPTTTDLQAFQLLLSLTQWEQRAWTLHISILVLSPVQPNQRLRPVSFYPRTTPTLKIIGTGTCKLELRNFWEVGSSVGTPIILQSCHFIPNSACLCHISN